MTPRRPVRAALAGLAAAAALAGCTSPEATRVQGGGPGGDVGNRREVVQMHEGSEPYRGTPRRIEPYGLAELEPARQARRLSQRDLP